MIDADPQVDAYLAGVPERHRPSLEAVRIQCRAALDGFTEVIAYGIPGYTRDGVVEIAWASRARYMALYVLRTDVLEHWRASLAGLDVGKGCVRFLRGEDLDPQLLGAMLAETAAARGPVC